ncbi:DnaJ domain-containing protein [Flavobacterium hauense]
MKDYYKILGVSRDASQAEIKKIYRALALEHHPDKNNGDSNSEERFKLISEAYIILGDTPKRNAYDFAQDNRHHSGKSTSNPGQATPVTYLGLFKKIKMKVLNAGGHINEFRLFTVINDLLSDDTIKLLIKANDVLTNNLIADEILVACVFLPDESRFAIHGRLMKLAGGDERFIQKIAILLKPGEKRLAQKSNVTNTESIAGRSIFYFVLFLILIIVLLML